MKLLHTLIVFHFFGEICPSSTSLTEEEIAYIRNKIHWKPVLNKLSGKRTCPFTDPPRNLVKDKWGRYLNDKPALIFPFCANILHTLGNYLGDYFNSIGCAFLSQSDFLVVRNIQGLTEDNLDSLKKNAGFPFLNALPDYIPHYSPSNLTYSKSIVQSKCLDICEYFCWTYENAPWLSIISQIKQIMRYALQYQITSTPNASLEGTILKDSSDRSTLPLGSYLPLVPDVAIHYRCGDNVEVPEQYGFLPFYAFLSIIPKHSKYIFILSDPPDRSSLHETYTESSTSTSSSETKSKRARSGIHEFTPKCKLILDNLFEFLQFHYPNAIIVLKRGGDPFLDFVRLSYAKFTICSSSTFCIWPAIASNGTAYFPDTTLIAGGSKPNFGDNFKWILNFKIISSIRKTTPIADVIQILSKKY
eukprot:gene5188-10376_t